MSSWAYQINHKASDTEVLNDFNDLIDNHREALQKWLNNDYKPRNIIPSIKRIAFVNYDREYSSIKSNTSINGMPISIDLLSFKQKKYIVSRKEQILSLYAIFREYEIILEKVIKLAEDYPFGFNAVAIQYGRFYVKNLYYEPILLFIKRRFISQNIDVNVVDDVKLLNYIQCRTLLRHINAFQREDRIFANKVNEEKEKERISNEKYLNAIKGAVSKWETISDIPYFFFYYYYPKRFTNISEESERVKRLIYNFKNGNNIEEVITFLLLKLERTFSPDLLTHLCFVCIPASTINSNYNRFGLFSETICKKTGMANGFSHIQILKEKTPSSLGGEDEAEFSLDHDFFENKFVLLFDDVVTRGRSMRQFKGLLEQCGATVVCALSIGRTYSDFYGDVRKPHPWSKTF